MGSAGAPHSRWHLLSAPLRLNAQSRCAPARVRDRRRRYAGCLRSRVRHSPSETSVRGPRLRPAGMRSAGGSRETQAVIEISRMRMNGTAGFSGVGYRLFRREERRQWAAGEIRFQRPGFGRWRTVDRPMAKRNSAVISSVGSSQGASGRSSRTSANRSSAPHDVGDGLTGEMLLHPCPD